MIDEEEGEGWSIQEFEQTTERKNRGTAAKKRAAGVTASLSIGVH